jgi:hypothetical protein
VFEMLSTVPAVREFSNNPEMPDDNNEDPQSNASQTFG